MANNILDKIMTGLSADALKYFFPGLVMKDYLPEEFIEAMLGGGCAPYPVFDDETRFSMTEKEAKAQVDTGTRFSISASKACDDIDFGFFGDSLPEPGPNETELAPRTMAFLEELEALKEKYGITIEEIEAALSYRVKLSHIRITRHKSIILDDFDHLEVKMDALTKTVFLLYLKHPEGIRYKDLCDHRGELESIYMSISGRSDLEGIRKSIDDLTDSIMSNSINEKVSKAKKAFRDVVDDRVARFYYIEGKQGAAKRIALDRSLVIWE